MTDRRAPDQASDEQGLDEQERDEQGLDGWADLIRDRFVALDIRAPEGLPFRGTVAAHHVGPLSVARVHSVPQDFRRTPGLIRRDDARFLQVGHLRQGTALLDQDDRRARLGAGDIVLYDTSRPFTWRMTTSWVLDVFTWSRDALGTDTRPITGRRMTPGPSTAIVAAALRQAGSGTEDVAGPEGDRLARVLADLVLCAADAAAPTPDSSVVGLSEVLAVIDANLRDPDLDPALVARRCHLSLRSAQRLFADQPHGLGGTIRVRRLAAARTALLGAPSRSVAVIAAEFCFSDASVFARAFRHEFGHSPRDCRDAALTTI